MKKKTPLHLKFSLNIGRKDQKDGYLLPMGYQHTVALSPFAEKAEKFFIP